MDIGPKSPKLFMILNYVFELFLNFWPRVCLCAKNAAHIDGSVAKKCKLERQRKKKISCTTSRRGMTKYHSPTTNHYRTSHCTPRRAALRRTHALPSWIWRAYKLRSRLSRLYLRSQNTFTSRIHLGSLTQVDLASDFYSSLSSFMVWPRPDVA